MATKRNEETPPEGFVRVDRPELQAWLVPQAGLVVTGTIVAHEITRYGPIVLLKTARAIEARPVGESAGNERQFQQGSIIGVGGWAALRPLLEYRAGTRVWIRCNSKEEVGRAADGRPLSRWSFAVCVASGSEKRPVEEIELAREAARAAKQAPGATSRGLDDIPF